MLVIQIRDKKGAKCTLSVSQLYSHTEQPEGSLPDLTQGRVGVDQPQNADCDGDALLLHRQLLPQSSEEAVESKLGRRVGSCEWSGNHSCGGKQGSGIRVVDRAGGRLRKISKDLGVFQM